MTPNELASKGLAALLAPRRLAALGVLARRQWRGTRGADDPWFKTLDALHQHNSREAFAAATTIRTIVAANPLPTPKASANTALVFAFRGQWPMHIVHHYLVALGLARIGFEPRIVVCGGGVERCGMSQTRLPLEVPPISCSACRESLGGITDFVPGTLSLDNYASASEASVTTAHHASALPGDFENLVRPALLRHFQGDAESPLRRSEMATYRQAGARYLMRTRALLDKTAPRAVVLFNGMFFPECLLAHECRLRGIALIHIERGVLPNSVFLSGREPACHYRSEDLWRVASSSITDQEAHEAIAFVESRRTRNIDPLGNDRGFVSDDRARYERLCKDPYAVFFAPVLHDTAAMGKDAAFGDPLKALAAMCDAAARTGVRLLVRAHPDERKLPNPARFTIGDFLNRSGRLRSDRITLLDSTESWNPYQLAERGRLAATFNGTIGMECPVLGIPIVNLGASHYIGKGFTIEPRSIHELEFLLVNGPPPLTAEARDAAARYLAFYLHHATLPTDAWIREKPHGMSEAESHSDRAATQLNRIEERVRFLLRGQGVTQ